MITSSQLRQEFLGFFQARGHKVLPSSSLVPQGDPTLLLTSAGMVPLKPYFTGERVPPSPRLASCQKCFRTSDIDSVGDTKHLTFFEMLGNFSIGDYFKREAIAWAWEFVTEMLKIPPDHLWVTYYKEGENEDLEAKGYWLEATKGNPDMSGRIVPLGAKYNWWGPAGEEGPCGPCSEIHYSYDPEHTTLDDLTGDSPRAVEIWNLVFTQFYHYRDGRRTPLPRPNIDTGMGLERTAAVLQGKASVYEADVFAPLISRLEALMDSTGSPLPPRLPRGTESARRTPRAGRRHPDLSGPEVDRALRIVAEHGRAAAFLLADGVLPSNEGRGYVLRRVLRRAALYGRKLGLEKPFLREVAQVVIGQMGDIYPELARHRDFVLKAIALEEERFGQSLNVGLPLIENKVIPLYIEQKDFTKSPLHPERWLTIEFRDGEFGEHPTSQKPAQAPGIISGQNLFVLHDTYGFPVELTQEIATEHGLSVDMEGFQAEMDKQRERARAAHKFEGGMASQGVYEGLGLRDTPFLGYEKTEHPTMVVGLLHEGEWVEKVEKGQEMEVVLAETPFYAEKGGQVGDAGAIDGPEGRVEVRDAVNPLAGLIVHRGKVVEGEVAVGQEVMARVDGGRRLDIARNHTATHLLQAALRRALGEHVRQTGSLVAPDRLRFDFSHLLALSPEELAQVETQVNEYIRSDLSLSVTYVPYREALERGAIALFDEKYGDVVRLVEIRGPEGVGTEERVSAELCGGTHLERTGQIGLFLITAEASIGGGLRRIEAVTGRGAEALVRERLGLLEEVAKTLQTPVLEVNAKAASNIADLKVAWARIASLEKDSALHRAEAILSTVKQVEGISVLSASIDVSSMDILRQAGDWLRDKLGSGVVVLGAVFNGKPNFLALVTPDLVARGLHAGELVKKVAQVAGGSGGGRPHLGQAGGRDPEKLEEALRQVGKWVTLRPPEEKSAKKGRGGA